MISTRFFTSSLVTVLSVLHSVSAAQGDVRLAGGRSYRGRVEVSNGRRWGGVCDDFWSIEEGHVVCHQLGFPEASQVYRGVDVGKEFGYGSIDYPIFLDDLRCDGNEADLYECSRNRGRHNCASNERAGVECLQSTDIRLMLDDQEDANMGFVEVSINGQWGKVCDDNWNMNSAAVACRQLGKRLAVWNTGLPDRYTDVQYVLDDLDCNGDETRLLDCGRRPLWRSNCGDGEAASVICT